MNWKIRAFLVTLALVYAFLAEHLQKGFGERILRFLLTIA